MVEMPHGFDNTVWEFLPISFASVVPIQKQSKQMAHVNPVLTSFKLTRVNVHNIIMHFIIVFFHNAR